jgi:ribonuclease-3
MTRLADVGLTDDVLDACEVSLDYRFRNRELLRTCLTHASGAAHRLASNERLEFLGDAILGAVVCETLYEFFPDRTEGELTRVKSVVVSRATCAKVCERLGLHTYLLVGKGLVSSDEAPQSVIAAVFESLIAGLYLDGGFEVARVFLRRVIGPEIEQAAEAEHSRNYKSQLQQLVQKVHGSTPVYALLAEKGPDHSKFFQVAAMVGNVAYPPAWGSSKKLAEQRAAQNALAVMGNRPVPHKVE